MLWRWKIECPIILLYSYTAEGLLLRISPSFSISPTLIYYTECILLPKPILIYLSWLFMLLHQYGSSYQVTKVKCLRALYEDAYEPMDFSCITSIILKHTLIHYISNYNEQKCSADVDYFSMCGIYCIFVHPRQRVRSSVALSEVSSFT